ncbi:hypothetical protein ACP70R_019895 [Stipagrostis hirtigluma subsp. patula]
MLATGTMVGRRRNVLMFPLPLQGHINPMLQLAAILHARGFAITVFHTHYNAPDPARNPEYRFVPVPDGMTGPKPAGVRDVLANFISLNAACRDAFRERLAAVLEEYSREAVACLVADAYFPAMVQVAAAQLALPTLVLRTSGAANFACFVAYPTLCDKGYLPVRESQLDTAVSELPPYRVRDLMYIGDDCHDLLRDLLAAAVAAVKDYSSGLLLNTFDAVESRELSGLRRDLAVPVLGVGPLHKLSPAAAEGGSLLRQDRSCLEWLDAQPPESVLYVSFGSVASMGPEEMAEAAWGVADSGVPFLWVVRPGLVRGGSPDQLPEGFEAATRGRGMVVAWAPQVEVLGHGAVGGFWTHGGWNSTTESICEGVPMLCRPHFGDQMGTARYVEHVWKVGFELAGELERGRVAAAIRRLMTEKDGAETRARARELKKAAAECFGKDGSPCPPIDNLVALMLSL